MSEEQHAASGGRPADDGPSAEELAELLGQLQVTAEQLGAQLGDLGRLGAGAARTRAEQLPAAGRLLELAPPELRARLLSAATSGLSATRDLADWALTQLHPAAPMPEPEELQIERAATSPAPSAAAAAASPAAAGTTAGAAPVPTLAGVSTTWILTASVDNHAATEGTGFSVIGVKERNRNRAMEIEPGDVIVLYLTKVKSFAGAIRVTGDLYEDRTPIWPGQPGKADIYPWRFATEPLITLAKEHWVPAETLRTQLQHVQKWPADHWTLAFQGQLRTVSEDDAALLLERLQAAVATA